MITSRTWRTATTPSAPVVSDLCYRSGAVHCCCSCHRLRFKRNHIPAAATHLLLTLLSFFSLFWFPLFSFSYSFVWWCYSRRHRNNHAQRWQKNAHWWVPSSCFCFVVFFPFLPPMFGQHLCFFFLASAVFYLTNIIFCCLPFSSIMFC